MTDLSDIGVGRDEPVDLTNCDREPIHIPGAILPHGAMLVLDCDSLVIEQAAGDTAGLLGEDVVGLGGRKAEELFSADQIKRLEALRAEVPLSRPRHLLNPAFRQSEDRPIDASVHRAGHQLILEFEAADLADPHAVDPLACVQSMLDGLDPADGLHAFCQRAAEQVRHVAGYDRVMIYRFTEDGSGWVFAEAKADNLESFLDLHYPASDIPKQARELYRKNWLRLIAQVDYTPAPLIPEINPGTGQPLDMSHAVLRDVSPIHRQYLRNMGVEASMSISILQAGELWGLISCHHYTPRRLPRHLRAICELFGNMFSLQLEARERAERFDQRSRSRTVLQHLLRSLSHANDYAQGLIENAPRLLNYIHAGGVALRLTGAQGGVALCVNEGIHTLGQTPSSDQIADLTDWLCRVMDFDTGVFSTDCLGTPIQPQRSSWKSVRESWPFRFQRNRRSSSSGFGRKLSRPSPGEVIRKNR